jgi:hypothetical protein
MSEIKIEEMFSILLELDDYVRRKLDKLQDRLNLYEGKYNDYYRKNQKLASEVIRLGNLASYNAGELVKWKHLYEKLKEEQERA